MQYQYFHGGFYNYIAGFNSPMFIGFLPKYTGHPILDASRKIIVFHTSRKVSGNYLYSDKRFQQRGIAYHMPQVF
jgi:hypothetical protein